MGPDGIRCITGMVRWLLKLNISKCKTVFYERNINYDYNYCLHSNRLDKVDRMKDLGITKFQFPL